MARKIPKLTPTGPGESKLDENRKLNRPEDLQKNIVDMSEL